WRSIARRWARLHRAAQSASQTAPAATATIRTIWVIGIQPESSPCQDRQGRRPRRLAHGRPRRRLHPMTRSLGPAPSLDDYALLAETAFGALPEPFRGFAAEAVIRVDDFADEAVLDEMGIQDPFELTGLYQGVDLSRRSVFEATPPPMIFLYRRPILDEWAERG